MSYNGSMQMIIYAGGKYLTGDEIAHALLRYSRALGDEDRAEIVEIPVQGPGGSVETASFLIGPASQIVTQSVSGYEKELEDPDVVARLNRLTRGTEAPTGELLDETERNTHDFD